VKFCIIGCGNIAKKHLHSINSLPDSSCVGISDIDEGTLNKSSTEWGIPGFTDCNKMIESTNPDVAVILTSSGSHSQIVHKIAPIVKRIIVEKPISLRLDDAKDMIELCNTTKTKLTVVKQNRFNVPVIAIKEIIDQKLFGNIFLGSIRMRWSRSQSYYDSTPWRGTWKHDGGALANQGIHFVDMIQWLMGDIESVFGKSINAVLDIEAEDTLVTSVKFKSGALATFEITTATRPRDIEGSISILGTKGSASLGGFAMNELDYLETECGINLQTHEKRKKNTEEFAYAHKQFYKAYIDSSHPQHHYLADGKDALKSISIIHAIYQSIEEDREIKMDQMKFSRLGS